MADIDPLDVALAELGYTDSAGLVDGPPSGSVARSFIWRELSKKTGVDATYFKGAVPLVAFLRAEEQDEVEHAQRQLWNLSRVPLLIASTHDRTAAYSCVARPPEKGTPLKALASAATGSPGQALADFSRESVEAGTPIRRRPKAFARRLRVDASLLVNLRRLRTSIHQNSRRMGIDALIGRAMFVRYLEDRRILTSDHLDELVGRVSFVDALEDGFDATYRLFDELANRFNGDVFAVADSERDEVTDDDLGAVAAFLSGTDAMTGQERLWPYDFSAIPPELISSIYEQLLEESRTRDAAYYTPRHVVDLILDEVLPWSAGSGMSTRILDPACGSGIFLTESFRRVAFGMSVATEEGVTFETLAKALTQTIWGVDRSAEAVRVSAFGLYLALLEEIEPPTAWHSARLPQLAGRNLIVGDYFDDHALSAERFDLVVGNPPWQRALTDAAASYLQRAERPVANKQIAQAFVWRAMDALKDDGQLALLLPAKSMLHNRSRTAVAVRRKMFDALQLQTVIDLSVLRHSTFAEAVAPAVVLVARLPGPSPHDDAIVHVAPKSNIPSAAIDIFALTQQDIQLVRSGSVAGMDDIWKVLLWGDDGDIELISRLRASYLTIGEVARERGWMHGRGFEATGDRNPAGRLRGMRFIATELVTPYRIRRAPRQDVTARFLHRPRNHRLYKAPLVLVRRGLLGGCIASAFVGSDAAFNNGLFGISAPTSDRDMLRLAVAYLNSPLAHYFHFLTNASWGVERDFIEASEHLGLPFALPGERDKQKVLSALDAVERDPTSGVAVRRLHAAVFAAYGLTKLDIQRVYDRLDLQLDQFRRGPHSKASSPVTTAVLRSYAATVAKTFRLFAGRTDCDVITEGIRDGLGVVRLQVVGTWDESVGRPTLDSVLRDLKRAGSGWASTVTVFSPSSITFGGDTAIIVKSLETANWSATAAFADVRAIVGGLASGLGDAHVREYARS